MGCFKGHALTGVEGALMCFRRDMHCSRQIHRDCRVRSSGGTSMGVDINRGVVWCGVVWCAMYTSRGFATPAD